MEKNGFIFINLFPYREKIKAQKIREFGFMMVLFSVLAGATIFTAHTFVSLSVDGQQRRNSFIEAENKKLDENIKSISGLKEEIKTTLAKRKVVEELQTNRSDGVNIMNEIANQLPEGSFIKSVKRVKDRVTIVGQTTSNTKVSNFMTNLEKTEVFENPELIEIKSILVVDKSKGASQKSAEPIKSNEFSVVVNMQRAEEEKLKLKDGKEVKEKPAVKKDESGKK